MQKSPEVKFFGFASASHPREVEIQHCDHPPSSQAPHPSISLVTLAWVWAGTCIFSWCQHHTRPQMGSIQSKKKKKKFAVPYSMLSLQVKSLYFWPLRDQGSSLQSSAEKFKTGRHQQELLGSEMRNSGVFQYWMICWKAHMFSITFRGEQVWWAGLSHGGINPSPIQPSLANI